MGKGLNVKRGDTAVVISGKDKGKKGTVLHVSPSTGEVIVEGANMIHRHVKPRSQREQGGIIRQEGRIKASNVMLVCPSCGKGTRVGHRIDGDTKLRVCKKCGSTL